MLLRYRGVNIITSIYTLKEGNNPDEQSSEGHNPENWTYCLLNVRVTPYPHSFHLHGRVRQQKQR